MSVFGKTVDFTRQALKLHHNYNCIDHSAERKRGTTRSTQVDHPRRGKLGKSV